MKITIEPTEQNKIPNTIGIYTPKISIEYPSDDLTSDDAMVLCAKALVAYGFNSLNIADCLHEDLSEQVHLPATQDEQCCEKGCCNDENALT